MHTKKLFNILVVLVIALFMAHCGGASTPSTDSGSVTMSGTLSVATSPSINEAKYLLPYATAAASYKVQALNKTTGLTSYSSVDASGAFTFSADPEDTVIIRFLDDDYKSAGGLVVSSDSDSAIVGLETPSTDSDLGSVVLNTVTGVATSDTDISALAESTLDCAATGGVPSKGSMITGENTSVVDDVDTANISDTDKDCVDNLNDIDNDGDLILDDQDGDDAIETCPGIDQLVLFMNNGVRPGDASELATGDNMQIVQHIYPDTGYTISSVSVEGPSYLDSVIVDDSAFYDDTSFTTGGTWDKTLAECTGEGDGDNHCMFISAGAGQDLKDDMSAGDTFIYTITFNDASTVTCTTQINSVLQYTLYNVRIGDDDADVASQSPVTSSDIIQPDVDNDGYFKIVFDIPAGTQLGFTHRFDLFPYDDSCAPTSGGFPNLADIDATFTGDTRTSAEDSLEDVAVIVNTVDTENWDASASGTWYFDLTMQDAKGDNAKNGGYVVGNHISTCTD